MYMYVDILSFFLVWFLCFAEIGDAKDLFFFLFDVPLNIYYIHPVHRNINYSIDGEFNHVILDIFVVVLA